MINILFYFGLLFDNKYYANNYRVQVEIMLLLN